MGALPWPPMYELSSGLSALADETGTHSTPPGADGGVPDPGQMSAGVMGAPVDSPVCPTCLVDLDAEGFCSCCGRLETGA